MSTTTMALVGLIGIPLTLAIIALVEIKAKNEGDR